MTRHARRLARIEAARGGRKNIEALKLDYLADRAQKGDQRALDDLIDLAVARFGRYLDDAPELHRKVLAELEGAPSELIADYEAAHARQVRAMRMLTGLEPSDEAFIRDTPAQVTGVLEQVKRFVENKGFSSFAHAVWLGLQEIVADCPRCAARMPEDEPQWAKTQQPQAAKDVAMAWNAFFEGRTLSVIRDAAFRLAGTPWK